jgi:hypothetical protein
LGYQRKKYKYSQITVWLLLGVTLTLYKQSIALASPTVCSIIKAPSFRSCLGMSISPSMCGFPPRPCMHFSYLVPQYYTEVTGTKQTFFKDLPPAQSQLQATEGFLPIAVEDDEGAFSYHGRTINVPFAAMTFNELPCGGAMWDRFCFSSMSEHLGRLWKTGEADLLQPAFMAWSLSPKACLIKGALSGATGESRPSGYPNIGMCSVDRSMVTIFPPSSAPVCSAWGINFPRTGTVTSSDQTTASLVIASRMKSLGSEVFQSVPSNAGEKMQMIFPQSSSCFSEGQNIGLLRLKRVNEMGRLWSGKSRNYLYATWKRVSCTRDIPWAYFTKMWLGVLEGACSGRE